jgi:hypothetical protein
MPCSLGKNTGGSIVTLDTVTSDAASWGEGVVDAAVELVELDVLEVLAAATTGAANTVTSINTKLKIIISLRIIPPLFVLNLVFSFLYGTLSG